MSDRINHHISNLFDQVDPDTRREAAVTLMDYPEEEAISALASALKDSDKGVRDAASLSLITIGGAEVVQQIVHYIGNSNSTTRNLAGELLINLGEHAIFPLIPYLKNQDHDVRKFAVDILGLIGNKTIAKHIVPLLDDRDKNVVLSAVEALGNIGDTQASPRLINQYEKHEYSRPTIVEALGKIGGKEARDFLSNKFLQTVQNHNTSPLLLYVIIEALGNIGNAQNQKDLFEFIPKLTGMLRTQLINGCIQISERLNREIQFPPHYKQYLLDALNADEITIQIRAIKGLSQFSDPNITKNFINYLGKSEELDQQLLKVLLKRSDSLPMAVEMLNQEGHGKKKEIIFLIGEVTQQLGSLNIGTIDENTIDMAYKALETEWESADEETQNIIINTLFRLKPDRILNTLDKFIETADSWLRIQIIELLSNLPESYTTKYISRFMEDEDVMVRDAAQEAFYE